MPFIKLYRILWPKKEAKRGVDLNFSSWYVKRTYKVKKKVKKVVGFSHGRKSMNHIASHTLSQFT